MGIDYDQIKQGQRAMWSAGDFPDIAKTIQPVSDALVEAMEIQAGQDVLDVATGSGNAAIPAARLGARVTGLDLTPELFDAARVRAEEAGVEVEWVEGDAEELPFADGSFDRVMSVFGSMFAPRQARAASEMLRVARPGGLVGTCAWTPDGLNGRFFAVVGRHMPPPPEGLQQPVLWGTEEHMRELWGDGAELSFQTLTVAVEAESPEAWVDYCEENLGPMIMAKRALEPEGRWEALRDDLVAQYAEHNEATDGTLHAPAEYLQTLGRLPA